MALALALVAAVWTTAAHGEPSIVAVYQGTLGSEPGRDAPGGEILYHVDVRSLDGVEDGAILVAFRRVPARRGDAVFREHPVWIESGRLQVESLDEGFACARLIAGPARPLPALDDDGLPTDRACIGDRVVDTGERGLSRQSVAGQFSVALLFENGGAELADGAVEVLRLWLHRYAVRGAVRVDVAMGGSEPTSAPASVRERVSPEVPGERLAVVEREEDLLALGQRRAGAVASALEQILGKREGEVLATVSWAADEATEAGLVHVLLTDAEVLPRSSATATGDESVPDAEAGGGSSG